MKIAVISDIHCTKAGATSFDVRPVVRDFVRWATESGADLLLDLGDRIDDVDRQTDLATAHDLAGIFAQFPGRRTHLLGNHDVVNLTADDHHRLFGHRPGHRTIDLGSHRLLVWEPSVVFSRLRGFPPAQSELAWLVRALEADDRPAIIVSHIPVSGAAMTGNYYFENNADFATYPDHADIRRAVARTGRAAIWLSGHVHWNSVANVGNTFHLTVQSASETFTTMPDPASAFALLEIDDRVAARFQVFGRDPLSLEIPFMAPGLHPWPEPRALVARG
ncbi:MAG: metallophosphoesterase [Devosia sp.]|nr:metallophosphoesterase [Devosia sp.]